MLKDYKGRITVKIDAIAASAASVVAMAGDVVQMSPVAMLNADKQKIENEAAIAKAEADKQVAITNAEAEAQKTSIAADAQAEANRKIAESLSEPLIEYEKIQKWDGKLPTVSGSNALVSIDPAE